MKKNTQSSFPIKGKKFNPDDTARLVRQYYGYNPELLFVECGKCGAPLVWEEGLATKLLEQAGIDPLELDPTCVLVTDGCPSCDTRGEYSVRVCRVSAKSDTKLPPVYGHA